MKYLWAFTLILLNSSSFAASPSLRGGATTSGGVINNGGTPTACMFGIMGDGCTAGQTESVSGLTVTGPPPLNANSVQVTWTSLQESGQSWASTGSCATGYANCHPPWNVAGVDYPVGMTSVIGLKDPAVDALPTGCSYASHLVTCSGQTSYDIEGWNFADATTGCVRLAVSDVAPWNGTWTLKNNKFFNSGNCDTGSSATAVISNTGLSAFSGGGLVDIEYNYIDGKGDSGANEKLFAVGTAPGGTVKFMYNAVLHARTEPGFLNGGTIYALFNYIYGSGYPTGDPSVHGHWLGITPPGFAPITTTAVYTGYLTLVSQLNGTGGTAMLYTQGDGAGGDTIYLNQFQYNNALIGNTLHSGGYLIDAANGMCWRGDCRSVRQTNNFVDTTGPIINCAAVAENTGGWPFTIPITTNSGNVHMLTGNPWNSMFKTDPTGNGYFTSGNASAGNPC